MTDVDVPTPKDYLKEKSKKFLHTALHTWATTGYDHVNGGYFEALDFDGNALQYDKRFRIHGRNMFSHAAGTVWGYSDTIDISEKAFDFISKKCWMPTNENKNSHGHAVHGGFASLTRVDGSIVDTSVKTYEHAFALLGLGWLAYATKKDEHVTWLNKVWSFVETNLSHPVEGFEVSVPRDVIRQSNPHMHTFEVLLNLYELFDDDFWLECADKIYRIFCERFFKPNENVLREFFTDDWHPDEKKGDFVDPGHHYEWTWLLRKYEKLRKQHIPQIDLLYKWAIEYGTDENGLGYDECYCNGTVYRNTHRLWVQTEVLKAHIAMSERTKSREKKEQYLENADSVVELLFKHYFIEDKGIWFDQLDATLKNISENAPSSTLYHIVIALNEYIKTNLDD